MNLEEIRDLQQLAGASLERMDNVKEIVCTKKEKLYYDFLCYITDIAGNAKMAKDIIIFLIKNKCDDLVKIKISIKNIFKNYKINKPSAIHDILKEYLKLECRLLMG